MIDEVKSSKPTNSIKRAKLIDALDTIGTAAVNQGAAPRQIFLKHLRPSDEVRSVDAPIYPR